MCIFFIPLLNQWICNHITQCQSFYSQFIAYAVAQSDEETTNAIDNEEVETDSTDSTDNTQTNADSIDESPPVDQGDDETISNVDSNVADSNDQSEPIDTVPSSNENEEAVTTNNDQSPSSDQNDATENVAESNDQSESVNPTDESENVSSDDVDVDKQSDQDTQEEITEQSQEDTIQNENDMTTEVVQENISEDSQEVSTESDESSEPNTTQPSASEAPGFTCEHVGRFEYPNSCDKYYYCWDTEHAYAIFHCPRAFDPVSKHCVDHFNGCRFAPTCEADRSVFAYPDDKTAYFECRANKKAGVITYQIEREYCSKGREFNPNVGYCELINDDGNEHNHEPSDHFVCNKVGIFIDFTNESRYYECIVKNVSRGELKVIRRKCPKDTMFSGESNTCIPIAR